MLCRRPVGALLQLASFLTLFSAVSAKDKVYITGKDINGVTRTNLDVSRKPTLYTGDFGDCSGTSMMNVTKFDAAYYRDNMTVLFHLDGTSNIRNESIMRMLNCSLDPLKY